MGYFEGLTSGSFKKDKSGNTVFFPWGVIGQGRVIPDEQAEAQLRRFVSRYYKISLPVIIGVATFAGWIWTLLLTSIFGVWFYFGTKALVSNYPYSEEKLTIKDGYANSAASHNKFTLWILFISCILFVIAGFFMASTVRSFGGMALGLFSVVFFGACGAAIGYMLMIKHRA